MNDYWLVIFCQCLWQPLSPRVHISLKIFSHMVSGGRAYQVAAHISSKSPYAWIIPSKSPPWSCIPSKESHFLTQLLKKGSPFFMPFIISHALSMVAANLKNPFFFKISMWCESYLHGLKESSLIKSHKKNKNSFHI